MHVSKTHIGQLQFSQDYENIDTLKHTPGRIHVEKSSIGSLVIRKYSCCAPCQAHLARCLPQYNCSCLSIILIVHARWNNDLKYQILEQVTNLSAICLLHCCYTSVLIGGEMGTVPLSQRQNLQSQILLPLSGIREQGR